MNTKSIHLSPPRLAAYITAVVGLLTALSPVVANLDITSTAGIIAGAAAVLGTYATWAKGWRAYEADERYKEERETAQAVGDTQVLPVYDEKEVPEVEAHEEEPRGVPPTLQ